MITYYLRLLISQSYPVARNIAKQLNIRNNLNHENIEVRLTLSRPNPGRRKKINLNFHVHTSLWCLKKFYEGL